MSKIIIESKLSNWIRISIYKHVQKFKNKELLTLKRSGWILLSFMFLQTSITAFQLMFSTGIFAHEMRIKASKVSNFNLVRRWLLIRFCLEKPLSHIAVLTGPRGTQKVQLRKKERKGNGTHHRSRFKPRQGKKNWKIWSVSSEANTILREKDEGDNKLLWRIWVCFSELVYVDEMGQVAAKIDKAELKEDTIVSKCNQSHADIFQVIFVNLFFL